MPRYWTTPVYSLREASGKPVTIDVTTSVAPGLPPHKIVEEEVIPYFKKKNVTRVLDFGAGALRHTMVLLAAGFEVCAVEYEETLQRPSAVQALQQAKKHANFSALVWPKDFSNDKRRFDAALLTFVLQVMPIAKERKAVLKYLYKKLEPGAAYVLYMSRFGQVTQDDQGHQVGDGYYRWPDRDQHSFYTEFTTEATHRLMESHRFRRLRSLSARGTEQVILYGKGKAGWP